MRMRVKRQFEKNLKRFIEHELNQHASGWKGYEISFTHFAEDQIRIRAEVTNSERTRLFLPSNHARLKAMALACLSVSKSKENEILALMVRSKGKKARFLYAPLSGDSTEEGDFLEKNLVLTIQTLIESLGQAHETRFVAFIRAHSLQASLTQIRENNRFYYHRVILNENLHNQLVEYWTYCSQEDCPIFVISFEALKPRLEFHPNLVILNGQYHRDRKTIYMEDNPADDFVEDSPNTKTP